MNYSFVLFLLIILVTSACLYFNWTSIMMVFFFFISIGLLLLACKNLGTFRYQIEKGLYFSASIQILLMFFILAYKTGIIFFSILGFCLFLIILYYSDQPLTKDRILWWVVIVIVCVFLDFIYENHIINGLFLIGLFIVLISIKDYENTIYNLAVFFAVMLLIIIVFFLMMLTNHPFYKFFSSWKAKVSVIKEKINDIIIE